MGTRNKREGGRWELEICQRLKDMGYEAVTSRSESRRADAAGIDIIGSFPFKIQAKSMQNTPSIHDILTTTEAEVIFWKKTEKRGKKFFKVGEYAMMPLQDFLSIINKQQ